LSDFEVPPDVVVTAYKFVDSASEFIESGEGLSVVLLVFENLPKEFYGDIVFQVDR